MKKKLIYLIVILFIATHGYSSYCSIVQHLRDSNIREGVKTLDQRMLRNFKFGSKIKLYDNEETLRQQITALYEQASDEDWRSEEFFKALKELTRGRIVVLSELGREKVQIINEEDFTDE